MATKRLTFYGKNRASSYDVADTLNQRQPFTMGAMHGTPDDGKFISGFGRLPQEERRGIGWADYVVYSYGTPIAWHVHYGNDEWWEIPDVKYSRTTTQHQSRIRAAVSILEPS